MAFSYKMNCRPTEYKTRVYRSQLEATWKVFFDVIILPSEYEPYELLLPNGSTYCPDFAISFANIPIQVMAEIKPVNFTGDTFHPSYDDEIFSEGTFGAVNILGYRKRGPLYQPVTLCKGNVLMMSHDLQGQVPLALHRTWNEAANVTMHRRPKNPDQLVFNF